ncbi:MAG: hypothetical protein KBC27_02500 [Rickettsiales bacterium]|nr:hypothetical protein [Rickettsiales bacterium]
MNYTIRNHQRDITYGTKGIIPGTWSGLVIAANINSGAVTGCISSAIAGRPQNIAVISFSYVLDMAFSPLEGVFLGSSLSILYNIPEKQGIQYHVVSLNQRDIDWQLNNISSHFFLNSTIPGELIPENDNMTIIHF